MFDNDQQPGKPKILFIGNPYSSHVQGWINLLTDSDFNVRLFACTDGCPPTDWKVKTYIISKSPPENLEQEWRESWWPEPETWYQFEAFIAKHTAWQENVRNLEFSYQNLKRIIRKNTEVASKLVELYRVIHMRFPKRRHYPPEPQPDLPALFTLQGPQSKAPTPQEWLADVIKSWQPDIIHTVGLDEGANFYAKARKEFHLEGYGKWVIKIFGGSDLVFKVFDPQSLRDISRIFAEATHVLLDNRYYANILITKQVLEAEKLCPLTPVPGSGGIDVDELFSKWSNPSSARRLIVWPKSYETIWSKAMPVLFALKNVWDRIQPCEVYMLATNSEIKLWLSTLPIDMQAKMHAFDGIPRKAVLDIMVKSRVLIAPSLVDGVPNSLYEAMACGALPIVSPIPTITSVVGEKNVLFANNLDQPGLEDAITKAMTDDKLVDEFAKRNLKLVKELADVKTIRQKTIDYYASLVK